ncbi:hypothetical protein B0T17DRAFT_620146 [Bombardia bombarda]|uniref:Uncharacterized protein n=1 Tax=Bombardia bombarda TaxID=252184 RepID=A0AA39WH94_9PEZI|nr:hypothetical protein B0T17DRAFT_620146 [Bombardia bombarda]
MAPFTPPTPVEVSNLIARALDTTPLLKRQATVTVTIPVATVTSTPAVTVIPSNPGGGDNSPTDAQTLSGGAIAGIVIGSIAGLLLLIWIIRSCSNLGAPPSAPANDRAWYDGVRDEYPPAHAGRRSHSHAPSHHSHRHSHSRHRSVDMREVPVTVVRSRSPRPPAATYLVESRDDYARGRRHESRNRSRY